MSVGPLPEAFETSSFRGANVRLKCSLVRKTDGRFLVFSARLLRAGGLALLFRLADARFWLVFPFEVVLSRS